MKNTNWKPFVIFGLIIVMIIFMGLAFLGMMISRGGDVGPGPAQEFGWPGMWSMGPFMMIFPCFGLVMFFFMMFFFFRMMMGGSGPMSGMMGQSREPQSQSRVSPATAEDSCPSCESPVQADWKVCPHCGYQLAAA